MSEQKKNKTADQLRFILAQVGLPTCAVKTIGLAIQFTSSEIGDVIGKNDWKNTQVFVVGSITGVMAYENTEGASVLYLEISNKELEYGVKILGLNRDMEAKKWQLVFRDERSGEKNARSKIDGELVFL